MGVGKRSRSGIPIVSDIDMMGLRKGTIAFIPPGRYLLNLRARFL
jgi:hypothetical protein